ncbi:La- protein 4 [Modicella reniformis]|uniref:La- protein 4 n=1 Tax=Modicella reniformis TaxID=1440133 RepID=A0A9P6MGV3_9FUNG|nr:La- protein 4 [Modicella reniformis]
MSSQQSNFQGQDDMGSGHQALQTAMPTMSAGAHDQGYGYDRLREQLEWYLSSKNLATDTYLVSKMNADHWVPISVIADFKKVKALTSNIQEVIDALRRSSKVLVDESGTMVKAITVDRPRTTLILRELPEDSTEEDIATIFYDAESTPKCITKELVGNMWFVEFETAEDALAMLHYTRGRYLRDVPIAARLKSNTVLTGGEYRVSLNLGNSIMSMFPPMHGWPNPPLDVDREPPFGASMPYRRFPADENLVEQEVWTSSSTPGVMPHGPVLGHHYPPGTYFSPNFHGVVPFAAPANPYCRCTIERALFTK